MLKLAMIFKYDIRFFLQSSSKTESELPHVFDYGFNSSHNSNKNYVNSIKSTNLNTMEY